MLKKILIALAALILIFVVIVAAAALGVPCRADGQDRRAAQGDVFAQVNDFANGRPGRPGRSSTRRQDRLRGPRSGQGAVMTWAGNDKVGEGKMTIVESQPASGQDSRSISSSRSRARASLGFAFKPEGDGDRRDLDHVGASQFHGEGVLPDDERQEDDRRRHGEGPGPAEIGERGNNAKAGT